MGIIYTNKLISEAYDIKFIGYMWTVHCLGKIILKKLHTN